MQLFLVSHTKPLEITSNRVLIPTTVMIEEIIRNKTLNTLAKPSPASQQQFSDVFSVLQKPVLIIRYTSGFHRGKFRHT